MAEDQIARSAEKLDLDRIYLGKVATAMAHNLAVVDKLLADETRFPKKAVTDDDRVAQTLKSQIAAVADEQRKALNLVNNALEADEQGRMKTEKPGGRNGIANATAPEFRKGSLATPMPQADGMGKDPVSFVGAAGLNMPNAVFRDLDGRTLAASQTTLGHTTYDLLAIVVETRQSAIAKAEHVLTPTVVGLSAACRGELAPAPTAAP